MKIKLTPEQTQRIESYILINHEFETMTELARSLDMPRSSVVLFCEKLNIIPVTPNEQIVNYATDHKHHQTISEMAKRLGIGKRYLKETLQKADLSCIDRAQEVPGKPTSGHAKTIDTNKVLTPQQRNGVSSLFLELGLKLLEVGPGRYRFVPTDDENRVRPPAEYNISVASDTVREEYETRGIKIK